MTISCMMERGLTVHVQGEWTLHPAQIRWKDQYRKQRWGPFWFYISSIRAVVWHGPACTPSTSPPRHLSLSMVLSLPCCHLPSWTTWVGMLEVQCSSVPRDTFKINHTLTQALPNVLVSD